MASNGKYVAIVDYDAGNLRSVQRALERFGATAVITSDRGVIGDADAMVFPGQGANDPSMRHLRERGLVEPIREFVRSGRPFLGVCLGLQLLLEGSDGVEFCSAVAWDNVAAVQFHPEKSGDTGLMIYRNFVGLVG